MKEVILELHAFLMNQFKVAVRTSTTKKMIQFKMGDLADFDFQLFPLQPLWISWKPQDKNFMPTCTDYQGPILGWSVKWNNYCMSVAIFWPHFGHFSARQILFKTCMSEYIKPMWTGGWVGAYQWLASSLPCIKGVLWSQHYWVLHSCHDSHFTSVVFSKAFRDDQQTLISYWHSNSSIFFTRSLRGVWPRSRW